MAKCMTDTRNFGPAAALECNLRPRLSVEASLFPYQPSKSTRPSDGELACNESHCTREPRYFRSSSHKLACWCVSVGSAFLLLAPPPLVRSSRGIFRHTRNSSHWCAPRSLSTSPVALPRSLHHEDAAFIHTRALCLAYRRSLYLCDFSTTATVHGASRRFPRDQPAQSQTWLAE